MSRNREPKFTYYNDIEQAPPIEDVDIPDTWSGFYSFEGPYDVGFKDELKAAIPVENRLWDKGNQVWWIEETHFAEALDIAETCFGRGVKIV